MLGKQSAFAEECFRGNFIGADFGIPQDLTADLPDEWRVFNHKFIPIFLASHPDKTKIGAGLACGALWTVAKGIKTEDVVLCPDGTGRYRVGEVAGEYQYRPDGVQPHVRRVRWLSQVIDRTDMSVPLKNSTGSIGTVANITKYGDEIETLLGGTATGVATLMTSDPTVEDPTAFAMEKHLENFLIQNWAQTDLGKTYDIYAEEGERAGQQYQTDTGPLDILAISKDKKILLVVELKKGRASDAVVGQVLRYMGYVKEELATDGTVQGVIVAPDGDLRIRRALTMVLGVAFYRYQIDFKLIKDLP